MKIIPYHINDPNFADALVDSFLEMNISRTAHPRESPALEQNYCLNIDASNSEGKDSEDRTIWRAPVDFPDAKPGFKFIEYAILLVCFLLSDHSYKAY